jgi:hypothetical protein
MASSRTGATRVPNALDDEAVSRAFDDNNRTLSAVNIASCVRTNKCAIFLFVRVSTQSIAAPMRRCRCEGLSRERGERER